MIILVQRLCMLLLLLCVCIANTSQQFQTVCFFIQLFIYPSIRLYLFLLTTICIYTINHSISSLFLVNKYTYFKSISIN